MCEAAKIRKSDNSDNRHLDDMLQDFISQKMQQTHKEGYEG